VAVKTETDIRTGMVFNIQRYSLNDGPGIRTVIFLKGCPLRCDWCCNPESISSQPHLTFSPEPCIQCGRCVEACPTGARTAAGLEEDTCTLCGACVEACPTGALEILGEIMSVEDILREVEKDRQFYQSSGGGVTISGGEILAQWRFALSLMRALGEKYLHIAIETTGYGSWERLRAVAAESDLVLYDLKVMDPAKHERHTGVSNEIILENARKLARTGAHMVYRVPLIGGVNADEENTARVADFAGETGIGEVHLLPYHRLGESKYAKLDREYRCEAVTPDDELVERLVSLLESRGLRVTVGG
jgi:pyruvate formate lyase activating enzyme